MDRHRGRVPASVVCLLLCLLATALVACSDPPSGPPETGHGQRGRPLPDTLYGVTVDDVDTPGPDAVAESLERLPHRPAVRLVFDRGRPPADYSAAATRLHRAAYVLGQPVDSYDVARYDAGSYARRFTSYIERLGDRVDLWEIGNELNGEWLGPTADVIAKTAAAYDRVRAAGGRTALTLYYNPRCWEARDHEMLPWARAHLPRRIRDGLDYVFVSYYEHDCAGYRPPAAEWTSVFTRLHGLFPKARLGFGEVGTEQDASPAAKEDCLRHYYGLSVPVPGWAGGWFWWYYAEDMVPYGGNPLWKALSEAMRDGSRPPGG